MEKANFVVSIKETQNGNWEGTIFWAQEKQEMYFRSSLELLILIESAISSNK